MNLSSKSEAQAKPEHTLINSFASQPPHSANLHKGAGCHIAIRRCKVRCIRKVERLGAELQPDSLRHLEGPEEAHIEIERSRTIQNVESSRTESDIPHLRERRWVVVFLTRPGPARPSLATSSLTRSARCEFPGAFSEVPGDVTVKGCPLYILITPFNCHPPSTAAPIPLLVHLFPLPNGNSTIPCICRLWVRSRVVRAQLCR